MRLLSSKVRSQTVASPAVDYCSIAAKSIWQELHTYMKPAFSAVGKSSTEYAVVGKVTVIPLLIT